MNPDLILDVFLLWSAQICVLVAAAALGAMTLTHPKTRLLFWQGLLLLLIFLPLLEPWRQPLPVGIPTSQMDALQLRGAAQILFAPQSGLWRREYWLALIGVGCALRLLWVGIGFLRLRRYRRKLASWWLRQLPSVASQHDGTCTTRCRALSRTVACGR